MSYQKERLADISSMRTGKLNSNAAVPGGAYPFFTCAQETYWIDKPAFNTEAVLLGGNNANGVYPLKYYKGEFNAYQRTYIFETLDANRLNIRYLYYALRPALSQFQAASIGAATQYLTKSILDNFKVSLPDIGEQNEIVAILSAYDDLIENNKRRIELLEESARQLYKEWFVRFCFPGHEHVKIIDGVPEGWDKKSIFEIWDISYGKNLPTKYVTEKGKYPVHGADSVIGFYEKKNVDEALCLVTCRGNGSGNVRRTFGESFVTNNSFVFRPKITPDKIHFHYAYFWAQFMRLQELRTGAAQPQITLAGINHLQALIPVSSVLETYNEFADSFFEQINNIKKQNECLRYARDLLLPKLMKGEIAV